MWISPTLLPLFTRVPFNFLNRGYFWGWNRTVIKKLFSYRFEENEKEYEPEGRMGAGACEFSDIVNTHRKISKTNIIYRKLIFFSSTACTRTTPFLCHRKTYFSRWNTWPRSSLIYSLIPSSSPSPPSIICLFSFLSRLIFSAAASQFAISLASLFFFELSTL